MLSNLTVPHSIPASRSMSMLAPQNPSGSPGAARHWSLNPPPGRTSDPPVGEPTSPERRPRQAIRGHGGGSQSPTPEPRGRPVQGLEQALPGRAGAARGSRAWRLRSPRNSARCSGSSTVEQQGHPDTVVDVGHHRLQLVVDPRDAVRDAVWLGRLVLERAYTAHIPAETGDAPAASPAPPTLDPNPSPGISPNRADARQPNSTCRGSRPVTAGSVARSRSPAGRCDGPRKVVGRQHVS